jgi:DNA-binding NarL/FixJ family response regulator
MELTPRESAVIRQRMDGATLDEIAKSLNIAKDTVKHHQTSALHRLQLRSMTELAALFLLPLNHPLNPLGRE